MYPNLSYLFHDLFGTEPDNWLSIFQTFGLFMALAFFSAAITLYWELKRKEKAGLFQASQQIIKVGESAKPIDIFWNTLIGFLIGFKGVHIFQNFSDFKQSASDVLLSAQGNWTWGILLAALFGGFKYWEKSKEKLAKPKEQKIKILPSDRTGDITIVAAVSGLLGAKIFALIETMDQFMQDPIGQLFSGSGLAIYGGLIGGAVGVIAYLRWKKIPILHFADAVAPGLMLSYGVGRIGCQLSGDGDWGIPVKGPFPQIADLNYPYDFSTPPSWMSWLPDWFYAYDYPHNVNNDGGVTNATIPGCEWEYCSVLDVPVFPTPLWEVIAATALFGVLWALRKKITIPGILFCIYLVFNGIERFWIEKWRINDKYDWLPFSWTQAELIAVLLMLTGVILGFILWRKKQTKSA